MATANDELLCCGLIELDGITRSTPKDSITSIFEDLSRGRGFAFCLFTDTHTNQYRAGRLLARYITQHKLGRVVATPAKLNTNSGNRVKMWTWHTNHTALKSWYRREDPEGYREFYGYEGPNDRW